MKKIIMWLKHKLGMNSGRPDTHWRGKKLFMCFKCECGKLHDCHDVTSLLTKY